MPIPVGFDIYQPPTLDLATPEYNRRAIESEQWQKTMDSVMKSINSIVQAKQQAKSEKEMPEKIAKLKEQGYDVSQSMALDPDTGTYKTSYEVKTKETYTPAVIRKVMGMLANKGVVKTDYEGNPKFTPVDKKDMERMVNDKMGADWQEKAPQVKSYFEKQYPDEPKIEDKIDVGDKGNKSPNFWNNILKSFMANSSIGQNPQIPTSPQGNALPPMLPPQGGMNVPPPSAIPPMLPPQGGGLPPRPPMLPPQGGGLPPRPPMNLPPQPNDIRSAYNNLRSKGIPAEKAKQILGIK